MKIDLNNIRNNALVFKRLTDRFLYAVVKADAYGHGAVAVANALHGIADGFAVALISEAVAIKQAASGKEVLIFTPPMDEEDVIVAANNGFTLTAANLRSAKLIVATAEKYALNVNVQVKVNTGMNRYGVYASTLGKVCSILKRSGQVRVHGVYSHLYSHQKELCEAQRLRFLHGVKICRRYFPLVRAHLSSTYGAALGKEYRFDAVRIGLGLYGYFPEESMRLPLRPAMAMYAPCVANRKCSFGGVGYGGLKEEAYGQPMSVLRAGYAEGLGSVAKASGVTPLLIGDLCMDVCFEKRMRKIGESVCLFSDARTVANKRGISVYECLCLMGLRALKVYIDN